ncbi:MAG TPA: polysaccharide pyruvyl transferase family protein [Candidatus Dormibacteraeota bacterium]|nr:polysaccharide pyruvyl transferase family protein [Candidatus Dormibacteraeota bacterium]
MTDLLLAAWVSSLIEWTRVRWMLGADDPWRPGEKLKLIFAGYNGAGNTGSDVRVEEMLRQVRHVLGGDKIAPSVMTQDLRRTRNYFQGANQVFLPDVFPPFLYREVRKYHGVVACEGSMFKSKFANALTTMMIGSLGIAAAQNKLSIGYGAEAGQMDRVVADMCARYCRDSLVITRNPESQSVLGQLGVSTELGTDTAWTFEPHPAVFGRKALRDAGWDGQAPVLVVCPINPFWWPVKASLAKFIARTVTGAFQESQYRTVYFHNAGPEVDAKYDRYISAFAKSVAAFRQRHRVFAILVAMERLDVRACRALATQLPNAPIFSSDDFDMYQLVSILRCGSLMISSRYHGIVTSMPGLVASAGVTMDERIRNLMHERGHDHLLLSVDEPELDSKMLDVLERLRAGADELRDAIGRTVVRNLKLMARMGVFFERAVHERYPEFPMRQGILSWEDYLPELAVNLRQLAGRHASETVAQGSAAS